MNHDLDRLAAEVDSLAADLSKASARASRLMKGPGDEFGELFYAINRAWHELDAALRKVREKA